MAGAEWSRAACSAALSGREEARGGRRQEEAEMCRGVPVQCTGVGAEQSQTVTQGWGCPWIPSGAP